MFRDGMKLLLMAQGDFIVVGERGDLEGLIAATQECRPDLLLVDYHMPGGDTAAIVSHLKHTRPEMRIVVLTGSCSGTVLQQLVSSRADAVLLKDDSALVLLANLRAVMRGQRMLSERVCSLIGAEASPLTSREMQVVKLICDGLSGPAIAGLLSLSPRTVDKHRENLMRKLEVSNTAQLLQRVGALGWFS